MFDIIQEEFDFVPNRLEIKTRQAVTNFFKDLFSIINYVGELGEAGCTSLLADLEDDEVTAAIEDTVGEETEVVGPVRPGQEMQKNWPAPTYSSLTRPMAYAQRKFEASCKDQTFLFCHMPA